MSGKDIGLLYRLIKRLVLTSKITRPDVLTCVSYIITRIKSPTDYHKDSHLNAEVLVMKKIQLLIFLSVDCCMDLELLFSKQTKYLLNIIQQIIQSQRLKAILTIFGVAFKNTKEWIHMNLRTDQVNYATKSQVRATTDARIANNKSTN